MLDNLDKELIKGLEKLDNKRMIQDEKNIDISTTNKVEKKILRDPKFKEIISMINEKEGKKIKRYGGFGKNDFLNIVNNKRRNDIFGNINLFSQKRNNNIFNTFQNSTLKKYGHDNNKFYISCIDGKAIVNGIRKEIPIVSKFNNINERSNNFNLFDDHKRVNTLNNLNRTNNNNNFNFNYKNEFTFKDKKNDKKFNISFGKDDINNNNTLKNNFINENWTSDKNYFKGGLKYFK